VKLLSEFLEVIVVTQEWAKDEMAKLPKQYGLDLQLVSVHRLRNFTNAIYI